MTSGYKALIAVANREVRSELYLGQRGLMMVLLEFHQRCHLLAMEGVKCWSASQMHNHSNPIVKECLLT